MDIASVNDVELEYEVIGNGEPVLFISPVLADGFLPLLHHPALRDHLQLIHYHRRGWVGSTKVAGPVSIADHAADAVALLDRLAIHRAHVVGHSSGAAIGAQLALDAGERVETLCLLELSLLSLPHGQAFLRSAGPVLEAYQRGEHADAFAIFMSAVSGLAWTDCRELLEAGSPGVVQQSIRDAETFFGIELPSLAEWRFDEADAGHLGMPVLSVLGTETLPLWVEVAHFLRQSVPDVDERTIAGAGHLLHAQRPDAVALAIARFLGAHTMAVV